MIAHDHITRDPSVKRLLAVLHDTDFTYIIPRDENRYNDGIELRYHFCIDEGYESKSDTILGIIDGPCSVLEMMAALALRMEEIMDDPTYGDRASQWFWQMIVNLGLGDQIGDLFDPRYVRRAIHRFLARRYERNGKGGLFTVRNSREDMRDVEIWYQMNWYLDNIT